jgi:histidine triad (HIT) family protein
VTETAIWPVEGCVFCDIVAGRSPASVVYADDRVTAFLDIRPVVPGHTIVVPNLHSRGLLDLDGAVTGHLLATAQRVAQAIVASPLRSEGVNLLMADGEAAGQDVFHSHLHIVPRFAGDGFVVQAEAWTRQPPPREELDRNATTIRRSL